ncbi:(Fe-S)-binding protein [Candidatus Pacearchaeota archaeon]|nr:(Fe-S)-binding protein [Candidatus Pacearchaeota archaeon]
MTIESENAREEIKEIVKKCITCGICKSLCPVFKTIREEKVSPRGKTMLLKKEVYDEIIYKCSLCRGCEQRCPSGIKICSAFKKARKVLVEEGKETEANKEMIQNIRTYGNPFGKIVPGKCRKLYCC